MELKLVELTNLGSHVTAVKCGFSKLVPVVNRVLPFSYTVYRATFKELLPFDYCATKLAPKFLMW